MNVTRKAFQCPIFGNSSELKTNVLPTQEDVMKYYEWTRQQVKIEKNGKDPSFADVVSIIAPKIEEIWASASIPVVSHTRILQIIKCLREKCKKINKYHSKQSFADKVKKFRIESQKLFDVSYCKCPEFDCCICPREKKVPLLERAFLQDQRSSRRMIIAGIDKEVTKMIQTRLERKQKSERRIKSPIPSTSTETIQINSSSESDSENKVQKKIVYQDRSKHREKDEIDYSSLSMTCDRFGISDRAGAAIVSSVIHGIKPGLVIDKNKIRRERFQARKNMESQNKLSEIQALYFDGRKDKTLIKTKKGNKYYNESIDEEHISLIKEPGSQYLGYTVPDCGTAKGIKRSIISFFLKNNLITSNLLAIGCDGTNANTGKYGGAIRLLETHLQRPLQWIICLLHMNELPLRHLFQHLDGTTTGPKTFSGPIGKLLETCERKAIVSYQRIAAEIPQITKPDLSTDQSYLYKICCAVNTGIFPEDLANKSPGKLSHARWLTRANRILRLYVATENPSDILINLATYVMKVYAPMWFRVKLHPSCKDGPRHLYQLIADSRYLPDNLLKIVDPVIQRNSYMAHSENILLAMLTDEDKRIRELGARRILKARKMPTTNVVRPYHLPKLNFLAPHYYDLIDWQENLSEPPLLKTISNEQLELLIENKGEGEFLFLRLPSHTQAVERAVKMVTESSKILCTKRAREGAIKLKLESRRKMPKFDSKKDFNI